MARCLAVLVVLVGCVTSKDIEGSDNGLLYPTIRGTVDLLRKPAPAPNRSQPLFAVEGGFTGGNGSFTEPLGTGQILRLDESLFQGPGDVRIDFRMREATLLVRAGKRLHQRINIEGIGGLGYNYFKVKANDGVEFDRKSFERFGPVLGVRLGWQALSWLEIYGRGTYLFLGPDNSSEQLEFGADFRVCNTVHLFLAYRLWRYQQEEIFESEADIDIRTDGIVLGLELRF